MARWHFDDESSGLGSRALAEPQLEAKHTNSPTMLCDRWENTPWGDPST